jgi:hypothetical protein
LTLCILVLKFGFEKYVVVPNESLKEVSNARVQNGGCKPPKVMAMVLAQSPSLSHWHKPGLRFCFRFLLLEEPFPRSFSVKMNVRIAIHLVYMRVLDSFQRTSTVTGFKHEGE